MLEASSAVGVANIVWFEDRLPSGLDRHVVLGGKGAGLAEMTQELGLPVPPGFVIPTTVCRQYLESGWPGGLTEAIEQAVAILGTKVDAGFGDPANPLLVSVRSGAPVSMPGMMDTLLNVGISPDIAKKLGETTGDAIFASDCWLRFCRMYAEIVLGLPRDGVGLAAVHQESAESRMEAADRIQRLAVEAGSEIPTEPERQLRAAIEAVFRSWKSERARVFRAHEGISEELGTAVTVQAMVFGNRDDRSGTGVAFTRNPSTGEALPFGDYLPQAQGEDVVAGTHAVQGLEELQRQLPAVYAELMTVLARLEKHYQDMCDVEFTVSSGKLYLLQTRVGRRTPLAAARIAVEMANDPDFPLDRAEAVARVDHQILAQLAEAAHVDPEATPIGKGLAASPGVGTGVLCCNPDRAAELAAAGTPVVLAREETSPEDVHGMINAAAIVTTKGGVVSHAAVVARSWSIPALTSLANAKVSEAALHVGGQVITEGQLVTVDGTGGVLYLGDQRQDGTAEVPWAATIREWAADLEVEPGTRAEESVGRATGTCDLFDVLRTFQLKGLCTPARAAAYLDVTEEAVAEVISSEVACFKETPRGLMLTPLGREKVAAALAEQCSSVGAALEECYEVFMPLNDTFKRLVTWWQLEGQAQGDSAFGRLVTEMRELHAAFSPVMDLAGSRVPRLAGFRIRFDGALAALAAGDASMLASPMKESYHTLWFDFHEELIALSGRDRANEET